MDNKVVSLSDKNNDNRSWSVEQMLEKTLEELRSGRIAANRAIICLLDDKDGKYNNIFRAANLANSQSISLLEIQKIDLHRAMGR